MARRAASLIPFDRPSRTTVARGAPANRAAAAGARFLASVVAGELGFLWSDISL
ncbi:hypothetical protein Mal64_17490 [Pseudobythopirellula maris]|uniref:Uncharacterized protein n=1 Tax=Pseudobythopirellula maris TaxID=2527991 RepID=A0A5C5ZM94_9BACT|nr:hypothetical protein Mal64_17490 [Pseudobythopirellula maris]